ncbi:hypothetical protein FHX08_001126 [Rhizobium sp. BK529]|uniref:hypothetical protein n=1 Tax=unclassified Rhizobium TaxID=2613769 RepID=UPI00105359C4|nr:MULTISPECIES: hypothetical protein [unclassified Rhizobium]MBB3590782.1 hypothetical protein [Rhizobium sp. BK529]TCS09264.1 hypothetical protein EV281_1011145 [Rhizobium sp. BK418]
MDSYRKLLVLGMNDAIKQGRISLAAPPGNGPTDEDGHLFADIAGYPSVVLWQSISYGELRVSVWWNYDHSKHPQAEASGNQRERFTLTMPLANRVRYRKFVGATASAWLERQTAKHLMGHGRRFVFDTYLRADMKEKLHALPVPKPEGYEAEGKFFL